MRSAAEYTGKQNTPEIDAFRLPPSESDILAEQAYLDNSIRTFEAVNRDPQSWAGAAPAAQGLYNFENDKDSCGVGFVCQIKGMPSHKIVSDARMLLCAMTHRGATGADSRDGDGAGVMTGIPHKFFKREVERDINCVLPEPGKYAVGNLFFKPNDPVERQRQQAIFARIAKDLGLRVLGWRDVPTDGSILGPAASSKEPAICQPFVVLRNYYGDGGVSQEGPFDEKYFERQLYVLRKHATHTMFVTLVHLSSEKVLNRYFSSAFLYMKYPCQMVLHMLPVKQKYRIQGTIKPSPSLQLLP